jgi:photosystem II stability/assembly factor-like uncharacterized protein
MASRPKAGASKHVVRASRKKGVAADAPQPRLSHHKKRSIWFQARACWPFREARVHKLVSERNRVHKSLPAARNVVWESIGPTNIGGRMTSIVCHPDKPDWIWAGAAAGGVWKSENAGRTWFPLWHSQESLNVGSLAIHPKNPALIYCGTGEANLSGDCYAGVGIYRTMDGGDTWTLLAPSRETRIPTRIGVIAIDPHDSKHLLIGGVGANECSPLRNDFGGIYGSSDGGVNWRRETSISKKNYWCHSIVFHPTKSGVIFAAVTEHGALSGIWFSKDGGQYWTQLRKGLPDPQNLGRTSLAISPSDPDIIYAFAECALSARSDLLHGVFRSIDGGKTWEEIGGKHFANECQISYGNAIVVHPKNPDRVLCGGVDLHLTINGGRAWRKVTHWGAKRGHPNYAHADHHHLVMPARLEGRVYDANDGGLDVSDDGGFTWKNRSEGLAITMYYDMDVAQSGRRFGGGTQDNGTLEAVRGRSDLHREILGKDGGWIVYDPRNAGHKYASCYNMQIWRWRAGWKRKVSPPVSKTEAESVWMAYIAMDPRDSRTIFTGSKRVWRTKDDGKTWRPVSVKLDDSLITAIEIAPADSRRIYVGTQNGGIFRSLDGGKKWSANLKGGMIPGHEITRIDSTAKLGADVLFVTVANVGHSHVFRSKDAGTTWEDVDNRQLPDVPHHAVVIRPDKPETVYVGNDAGVFVTRNSGKTWTNMTANLPNVMVVDLVLHEKDATLSAATYGRSLWRTSIECDPF